MQRLFKELPLWDLFSLRIEKRMRSLRKISDTQAEDIITGGIFHISPDTEVDVL